MRRAWLAIAATLALAGMATPLPTLAGSGTVTGTLVDENGQGVSGQIVHACGSQGCVQTQQASDKDGHYVFSLPAGNGWNVFAGDCTRFALSHKFGVNVTDGASLNVNLRMTTRWGAIAGRVLDDTGAPIAGVGLLVDNSETGGFGFGYLTSAADGTYTAGCLAAGGVAGGGAYFITAGPPAGSPYGGQQDSGIHVAPNQTTAHDVVLHKGGGTIAGHVRCNGGRCPSGASILIYCEGCTSSANTPLDQNGGYALGHLAAGQKYDVHAVAPAGWDNGIHYGVTVREHGQTIVDFNLVPAGALSSGRLTGRITDAAGGAHGQCLINAFGGVAGTSAGGWTDGDVYTADDGIFDTGYQLVPGQYLVFLVCPGWPQVQLNSGKAIKVMAGTPTAVDYVFGAGWVPASRSMTTKGIASAQAFFAAGSTTFSPALRSQETIVLTNMGDAQTVSATYLFSAANPIVRTYALDANATLTINVNHDVGANRDVSVSLSAAQPFVAQRSIAIQSSDGINGMTQVAGTPSLSTSWFFPSGSTAPGIDDTLILMNPNSQSGTVGVVYNVGSGVTRTVCHDVPPMGRVAISVGAAGEAGSGSAQIVMSLFSDTPILAEEEMLIRGGSTPTVEDIAGSSSAWAILNVSASCMADGGDRYLALSESQTATLGNRA